MTSLFNMAGGGMKLVKAAGGDPSRIPGYDRDGNELPKPEPPPPEPLPPPEPPPPAPEPAAAPPPEAPTAVVPTPKPAPEPIVPVADPYASKRGEVQRLAQARARRSQQRATIIGSDTLG